MAVILERVLKIAGIENNSTKSDFADFNDVSDYAKEAVDMLAQYDMHASANGCFHIQIVDATGTSVVVSYVNNKVQNLWFFEIPCKDTAI